MGCGKSSVGRKLSELLCCPIIDLDDVIVESAGRSIPEIFESEGEQAFRQMELEVLKRMMPKYSRGSLQLRGSLPLAGGSKMPLPYNRHTPATQERKCQVRPSVSSTEDVSHHCKDQDGAWSNLQSHLIKEKESPDLVLALGGGAVMTKECAEIVWEETCCVYLKASIETLMEHLSGEADGRPLLQGTTALPESDTSLRGFDTSLRGSEQSTNPLYERITELMAQRSETYEKTAHIIIDTDGKSIEAIAQEILELLK